MTEPYDLTELEDLVRELESGGDSSSGSARDTYSQIMSEINAPEVEPTEQERPGDLIPGLKAGAHQTVNLINNAGNSALYHLLYKATGNDQFRLASEVYYNDYNKINAAIAEKYPRNVESLKDVKGVGDAVDWTQRMFGEGITSWIPSLAVGTAAAGMGAGPAAIAAAVTGSNFLTQALPESHANFKAAGVDDASMLLFTSALKAGLDSVTPFQALKKVFPGKLGTEVTEAVTGKLLAKTLGKEVLRGMATEGTTETAQTFADQAAISFLKENEELFSSENLMQLLESGLAGAIVGGPVAGAASSVQHREAIYEEASKLTKTLTDPIRKKWQERVQRELDAETEDDPTNPPSSPAAPDSPPPAEKFTDAGTARKYIHSKGLTSDNMGDDFAIKAANKLYKKQIDEMDLSEAAKTLYMDNGQKRLTGPRPIADTEENRFYRDRAMEIMRTEILKTKDAVTLVAHGIDPSKVVEMDFDTMARLAKAIPASHDTMYSKGIGQDVLTTPQFKGYIENKGETTRTNLTQSMDKADLEWLQRNRINFDMGNGVIFNMEPEKFWDEMAVVDAQNKVRQEGKNAEVQGLTQAAQATANAPPLSPQNTLFGKGNNPRLADTPIADTYPVSDKTLTLPNNRNKTLIAKVPNHPVPETKGLDFGKNKETKLRKPLNEYKTKKGEIQTDDDYTKALAEAAKPEYKEPYLPPSKQLPWKDSRAKKNPKTRHQTLIPSKEEQKLFQQTIVPNIVYGNMRATPVRFDAQGKLEDIAKNIERIVQEIAGKKVKVEFVGTLESVDPLTHEPVATLRGAQERNVLYIALGNNPDAVETAAHEAWHYIRDYLGLLSDADKKLLDLELPRITKWLEKELGMSMKDFEASQADSSDMKAEIEATAFGKIMADSMRGQKSNMSSPALRVFQKAVNFFNRLKNYLRGAGFRTFEDLFDSVAKGQYSKAADYHDASVQEMSKARFQTLARNAANGTLRRNREALDTEKVALENMKTSKDESGKYVNWLYTASRYMNSAAANAHSDPLFGVALRMMQDKADMAHHYLTRYQNQTRPFFKNFSVKDRYKVSSLTNRVRSAGSKAEYLDAQGQPTADPQAMTSLRFKDADGKIKMIRNQKVARGYHQLQASFNQALHDIENDYRNALTHHGLPKDMAVADMTSQLTELRVELKDTKEMVRDLADAIKSMPENQRAVPQAQLDSLREVLRNQTEAEADFTEIRDNLAHMEELRKVDYFPHMRFGHAGLSVWNVADLDANGLPIEDRQPAYFTTFEKGFHKGVDKFQWDLAQKELRQRKMLNNPQFKIFGGDKPFYLTHGALEGYLTPQMLTYELMAGLAGSADPAEYEAVRKKLESKLAHKNFAKILTRSNDIPGYSKDFNRVIPMYFSGVANMLAKNSITPRMNTFKAMIKGGAVIGATGEKSKGINPERLKNIEDFLNYVESPTEDALTLRQLNFMWTMGMNFSTATLQVFTLPTSTLSSMNQYRMSPIKNAALISKWFAKGGKLSSGFKIENGRIQGGFQDADKIRALADRGQLVDRTAGMSVDEHKRKNAKYADALIEMSRIGGLKDYFTEDYAGQGGRDIRQTTGRVGEKMSQFTNFLGVPMGFMESLTRFATFMAHFDLFMSDPETVARAERLLANDGMWQAMRLDSKNSVELDLARFGMDEAHAIFGKIGRHKLQRGWGAVALPFMTYPQQQLEYMYRLYKRGNEGKAALALHLGVLMIFAGMMGLPGAELLKEAYEAAHKKASGHEIDLDKIIRDRVVDMTNSPAFAVFLTQGIGRPVLGMDISKRLGMGLAYPGSSILTNLLSGRDTGVDALGVQGSMIINVMKAWENYGTGEGGAAIAENLTPNFFANIIKQYRYGHEGVISGKGTMLVKPEDMGYWDRFWRGFGVTPGIVADAREKAYWSDMTSREYDTFLRRERAQMANTRARRINAQRNGDTDIAKKYLQKEQALMENLKEWKKSTNYPLNFSEFNQAVRGMVKNRLSGEKDKKKMRKHLRRQVKRIEELTSID